MRALGSRRPQLLGLGVDGLDPVVHVEDLATAVELAQDRVAHQAGRGLGHARLDGQAVLRRGLDDRHVAHAHQREVERARDGRGAQGQHVDLGLELLEAFLVGDAEALLLVDHHEAKVLEVDVLREQPVGADDDVDAAGLQARERVLLLAFGHEAAERTNRDGIGREALLEGQQVLRCQHGRGHQHRHLGPRPDGLEGGAQGDLRLAVAHVADDQTIHRRGLLEIGLDVDRGAQLVGRLLVGKGRFHLRLPGRVLAKGAAVCLGPVGVEAKQVAGKVAYRLPDPGPCSLPLTAAELGELRMVAAGVARDALDLLDGDPDAALLGEVQLEVVALF